MQSDELISSIGSGDLLLISMDSILSISWCHSNTIPIHMGHPKWQMNEHAQEIAIA